MTSFLPALNDLIAYSRSSWAARDLSVGSRGQEGMNQRRTLAPVDGDRLDALEQKVLLDV